MSATSSSRPGIRRRAPQTAAPAIPLVPYPNCGRQAQVYLSGTNHHLGWTFYKCKFHSVTCNFWHWEREYVYYLIENNVLKGDAAVEALGWAEERREELELALGKKRLAEEWGRGSGECIGASSGTNAGNDESLMRAMSEMIVLGREMVLLLKIGVAMLCFIVVAMLCFVWKK